MQEVVRSEQRGAVEEHFDKEIVETSRMCGPGVRCRERGDGAGCAHRDGRGCCVVSHGSAGGWPLQGPPGVITTRLREGVTRRAVG